MAYPRGSDGLGAYMYERGYGRGLGQARPVTGSPGAGVPRRYIEVPAPQDMLETFPIGPGRAAAPGAAKVCVSDSTARRTTRRLPGRMWAMGNFPGPIAGAVKEARRPIQSALGIAPVLLPAATSAVTQASKAIFGFVHTSKNPQRFAANQEALNRALQGDVVALQFLGQRGGVLPRATLPGYGDVGTWATAVAQEDAAAKYQQAQQAGVKQTITTTPGGSVTYAQPDGVATGPGAGTTGGGPTQSNVFSDLISGFLQTPVGQQTVKGLAPQIATGARQAAQQQIAGFVAANALPIVLGVVGLAIFASTRRR